MTLKKLTSVLLILSLILTFTPLAYANNDDITVADFGSGATAIPTKWSEDTEIYRFGTKTAKWENTLTNYTIDIPVDSIDASESVYFNQLIYSGKATGAKVTIVFLTSNSVMGGSGEIRYNSNFVVDWEGWKIVSLKLSTFAEKNSPNWNDVDVLRYRSTWGTNDAREDTVLNFEKMWFSKEEIPQMTLESTVPANDEMYVELDTTEIIFNFSNDISESSVSGMSAEITNATSGETQIVTDLIIDGTSVIVPVDGLEYASVYKIKISGGYDVYSNDAYAEIKFSTVGIEPPDELIAADFGSGETAIPAPLIEDTEVVRLGTKTGKWINTNGSNQQATVNIPLSYNDVSNYNYFNQLIYSKKATNAPIHVVFFSNGDQDYFRYPFKVDWEGWKLVKIPLSAFGKTKKVEEPTWKNITIYRYRSTGWTADGEAHPDTELYLEKTWFSKNPVEDADVLETVPANGSNDVEVKNDIVFSYTTPVAPLSKDSAKISIVNKETNAEFTDFSVDVSGNKCIIDLNSGLDFSTVYDVTVSGLYDIYGADIKDATISFETKEKSVLVSDFAISLENGVATASVEVENNFTAQKTVTLILVAYNADGRCEGIVFDTVTLDAGAKKPLTKSLTSGDIESARAFIVDDTDNLEILSADMVSTMAVEDESQFVAGDSDTLTLKKFEFLNDIVSIEAEVNGGNDKLLLFTIKNSAGEIIHAYPFKNTNDGKLSLSYKMTNNEPTDIYTVSVSGRGIKNSISEEFCHLRESDKETIRIEVNRASASEVLSILSGNKIALGMADELVENSAKMTFISASVAEKTPFDKFDDIKNLIVDAEKVYDNINSLAWDSLAGYILDNKVILIGNHNISYFEGLTSANRNRVMQFLIAKKPFTTPSDFRSKLDAAINEYKASLSTTSGGGGGGGGGSSRPGSSGGSKGGSSGGFAITGNSSSSAVSTIVKQPAFNDLGTVEWAKESILSLADKNIISQAENKLYRPLDSITRAEFIKLLVCALYSADENAKSEFSDIPQTDWSYPYVSTALSLGLVNGREDGSYGKDASITRQEMAAIICRALINKGINLNSDNSVKYSDDSAIEAYALDAVYTVKAAGIMSGMENNVFAPAENANRAQAAVVIDRLIKLKEANNG